MYKSKILSILKNAHIETKNAYISVESIEKEIEVKYFCFFSELSELIEKKKILKIEHNNKFFIRLNRK